MRPHVTRVTSCHSSCLLRKISDHLNCKEEEARNSWNTRWGVKRFYAYLGMIAPYPNLFKRILGELQTAYLFGVYATHLQSSSHFISQ